MDPRQRPLLRRRLGIFKVLAWSLVALLVLIYAWLQLVRHGEFKQLAMQQAVKVRPIPAPRGLVLDRNGQRLVDNRRALHLVIQREDLPTRPEAVSYTHLRAHETDSYLVCRLLLEKKKKKT